MSISLSEHVEYAEKADEDARQATMELLQDVASAGSQRALVETINCIDWDSQPAAVIKQAIDLALEKGCHATAAELASKGHKLFPEHPTLARIAGVLAPPKFIRTRPPVPGIGASMIWLEEHTEQYRGKWVAIRNGELLTATDSRVELSQILDSLDSLTDVLVTKIS